MLSLEEFTAISPLREGHKIVRCGCSTSDCPGWAEIRIEPWGLRPWEAEVTFVGPLVRDDS